MQLFAHGRVRRGFIGVPGATVPLPRKVVRFFDLQTASGVRVMAVAKDGPAAEAGLLAGDLLVAIDDQPVLGIDDMLRLLNHERVNVPVKLSLLRKGEARSRYVTPFERRYTALACRFGAATKCASKAAATVRRNRRCFAGTTLTRRALHLGDAGEDGGFELLGNIIEDRRVEAVARGDFGGIDREIAHQALDDLGAHAVFRRRGEAAGDRAFVAVDLLRPFQRVARRLHEALRELADGRGAEGQQRVGDVRRVALEIAAHGAVAGGGR